MKHFLLKALLCTGTVLSAQTLSTSLSACYDFAGNANDLANSLNGTVFAASLTTGHSANPSSAYLFNGTPGSYIKLPNSPLLKNTTAVSYVGWFKVVSFIMNDHIIFAKNTASSAFAAFSLITTGSGSTYFFRAYKENGSTSHFVQSTNPIVLNTWYHVAATIDNAAVKLYVNGVLQGSVAVTIPFSYDATRDVILGGTNELNYNTPFNGAIDNLRFYSRVLSASEVSSLYTNDPSCLASLVPETGFTINSNAICVGKPITMTDTSTNNPTQWTWQVPGAIGSNTAGPTPTFTFNTPGSYSISLTTANSFGTSNNTAVKNITVFPQPTVTAVASRTLLCKGESVVLTAAGAATYVWMGGATTQTVIMTPIVNTGYIVTGTDANGCTETATVIVKVATCIDVMDISKDNFSVYPNPVNDILNIDLKTPLTSNASIYSSCGQLVKNFSITPGLNVLSIPELGPGIYVLVLDGVNQTKTFVKK